MLRSFRSSWKRDRTIEARNRLEIRKWSKKRELARNRVKRSRYKNREAVFVRSRKNNSSTPVNGCKEDGNGSRELEREYYEHLEALKFLIEPPASFRSDETRQNFENKLNTLDFRRMNTVAIPETVDEFYDSKIYGKMKNPDSGILKVNGKRKSGFRFSNDESLDIERTMIDLFVRAPILKSKKMEAVRGILFNDVKECKSVRFEDENEDKDELDEEGKEIVGEEKTRSCIMRKKIDAPDVVHEEDILSDCAWTKEGVCSDGSFDKLPVVTAKNGKLWNEWNI